MNDSQLVKPDQPESHPTTKPLPDSVRLLLKETYREAEYRWRPAPVPAHHRTTAQRYLSDLEYELQPAERSWIVARVITLLAHYWMPDMDETLQQAVGSDWANILGSLPRHAIESGCISYASTSTRARPTPGQILELAQATVAARIRDRDRLVECLAYHQDQVSPRDRDTPEEREAAVKKVGEIIRQGKSEVGL